jgi:predicted RNase H-like nuclease (RuvC/YqgF family)
MENNFYVLLHRITKGNMMDEQGKTTLPERGFTKRHTSAWLEGYCMYISRLLKKEREEHAKEVQELKVKIELLETGYATKKAKYMDDMMNFQKEVFKEEQYRKLQEENKELTKRCNEQKKSIGELAAKLLHK